MSEPTRPSDSEGTQAPEAGSLSVSVGDVELERAVQLRPTERHLFALIFGMTVIYAFGHVGKSDWGDVKELLQILIPAETALLGAATGFYFAGRNR